MTDESRTRETAGLHVYVVPPIDLWFGWKNLEKLPSDAVFPTEGTVALIHNVARKEWRAEVDRLLFSGRKFAEERMGYTGDIERGPFLSMVPGRGQSLPIVAWVTSDRDLTFVASPIPLPHLDALKDEVVAIRAAPPVSDNDIFGKSAFRRED